MQLRPVSLGFLLTTIYIHVSHLHFNSVLLKCWTIGICISGFKNQKQPHCRFTYPLSQACLCSFSHNSSLIQSEERRLWAKWLKKKKISGKTIKETKSCRVGWWAGLRAWLRAVGALTTTLFLFIPNRSLAWQYFHFERNWVWVCHLEP